MRFSSASRLQKPLLNALLAVSFVFCGLLIFVPQKAYAILNLATDFEYSYIVEDGNLRIYAYVRGDNDRALGWTVSSRTTPGVCSFVPFFFDAEEINSHDDEGVGVPVNDGVSDLRPIGAADALLNIAACDEEGQLQNPGGQPANITIGHPERHEAFDDCLEAGTTVGNMQTCVEERVAVLIEEQEDQSCEGRSGFADSWFYCPVIRAASGALTTLDTAIGTLLNIQTEYYQNADFETAWGVIRNLAYIMLVPVTLVMVIATALGFEFISAYTVKRALPRLVLAVIGIALSYQLCVFLIDITQSIGAGTLGIITAPFPGARDLTLEQLLGESVLDAFLASAALVILVIFLFTPMLVAVLTGFLVLILRQMLIVGLILASPLALLGWIFPANQRLWNMWWGMFSRLLLMYPMVMALIALGRVFASLINSAADEALAPGGFASSLSSVPVFGQGLEGVLLGDVGAPIMAGVAFSIPYGLVPLTYAAAGTVLGFAAGKIAQGSQGFVGGLTGAGKRYVGGLRQLKKQRDLEKKEQKRKRKEADVLGGNTRMDQFGEQRAGFRKPLAWAARKRAAGRRAKVYRQTGEMSGWSRLPGVGNLDRKALDEKYAEQAKKQGLEGDIGVAGNDLATSLTAKGLKGRAWDKEYQRQMAQSGKKISRKEARRVRKQVEKQWDVRTGSVKAKAAGWEPYLKSGTNSTPENRTDSAGNPISPYSRQAREETLADWAETVAPLIADGHKDVDTAAAHVRQLTSRPEYGGGGHKGMAEFLDVISKNYKAGKRGRDILMTEDGENAMDKFLGGSLEKLSSGQVMGADKWSVEMLVPHMVETINEELRKAAGDGEYGQGGAKELTGEQRAAARKKATRMMGTVHGWTMLTPHASGEVQKAFADGALDQELWGQGGKTLWEGINEQEAGVDSATGQPFDNEDFIKASRKLYPNGGAITPEMLALIQQGLATPDMAMPTVGGGL